MIFPEVVGLTRRWELGAVKDCRELYKTNRSLWLDVWGVRRDHGQTIVELTQRMNHDFHELGAEE